jgi:DNA-directed RNA polymerase subunit RPC12/RpoP
MFIKYHDIRLICRHACHKYSRNHNGGLIRELSSSRKNENNNREACVCPNDECGRSFEHPLQLTVLSSDPVETYAACPYCMSKIELEEENQPLAKQVSTTLKIKTVLQKEKENERQETTDQGELKCEHGFGYLKNRPKGTSIPDDCLLCQKMIQCLH